MLHATETLPILYIRNHRQIELCYIPSFTYTVGVLEDSHWQTMKSPDAMLLPHLSKDH